MKYIFQKTAIFALIFASAAIANEIDPLLIVSNSSLNGEAGNKMVISEMETAIGGTGYPYSRVPLPQRPEIPQSPRAPAEPLDVLNDIRIM